MREAILEPVRRESVGVDVFFLPGELTPEHRVDRSVVVFDVLRATTSITSALSAGVTEVRVFGDIRSAERSARAFGDAALLCGEVTCLRPSGFELGNSPGEYERGRHAGRVAFLSTTNGTKAIIAARGAAVILVGALVNATAIARRLAAVGRDVSLLCAGTQGRYSMEDVIGAGAVIDALESINGCTPSSDSARMALRLFRESKSCLRETLSDTTSGGNLRRAGLEKDIDFCAVLDSIPIVGVVCDNPLRVVLETGSTNAG